MVLIALQAIELRAGREWLCRNKKTLREWCRKELDLRVNCARALTEISTIWLVGMGMMTGGVYVREVKIGKIRP